MSRVFLASVPRRREACRVRARRSSTWQRRRGRARADDRRRPVPRASTDGGQAGHRPGKRRGLPAAVPVCRRSTAGKLTSPGKLVIGAVIDLASAGASPRPCPCRRSTAGQLTRSTRASVCHRRHRAKAPWHETGLQFYPFLPRSAPKSIVLDLGTDRLWNHVPGGPRWAEGILSRTAGRPRTEKWTAAARAAHNQVGGWPRNCLGTRRTDLREL